jgi:hypothetical protein
LRHSSAFSFALKPFESVRMDCAPLTGGKQ